MKVVILRRGLTLSGNLCLTPWMRCKKVQPLITWTRQRPLSKSRTQFLSVKNPYPTRCTKAPSHPPSRTSGSVMDSIKAMSMTKEMIAVIISPQMTMRFRLGEGISVRQRRNRGRVNGSRSKLCAGGCSAARRRWSLRKAILSLTSGSQGTKEIKRWKKNRSPTLPPIRLYLS